MQHILYVTNPEPIIDWLNCGTTMVIDSTHESYVV